VTQSDLVQLARQGDEDAIAALLHHRLKPIGISLQVSLVDQDLLVLLEAVVVPDPTLAATLIRRELINLRCEVIHSVKIQGKQFGEARSAWVSQFEIVAADYRNLPAPQPHNRTVAPVRKHQTINISVADLQRFLGKFNPFKAAFMALLAVYGWAGAGNYTVSGFLQGSDRIMIFLHGVNLIFHEAGHVFFLFLGDFLHILGGSLTQVLIPASIAGYFFFTHQPYAGAVTLCWAAQNLWDVSIYIKDAQDRALPLLGGADESFHDWYQLLLSMNLLTQDQLIGNAVYFMGSLLYCAAVVLGFHYAQRAKD
jgi:hypothetical protein